jgi:apolipoprotein N-acyltransferase
VNRPDGAAAPSPAAVLARGLFLPGLAGALAVLGFAPFYAWPIPILSLALLFGVWDRSDSPLQACLSGFAFGLGLNLAGVSWVFVSMHDHGDMPAALAAIATFLLCSLLAAFPALAGWALLRFCRPGALRIPVAASALFVACEWIRGWIFTGFPWLAMGYSQAPASPLAGYAPVLGAYGVSLAVAGTAALLAAMSRSQAWSRGRAALAAAIAIIFLAGAGFKLVPWTQPSGDPVSVALVQGNVPQSLKWRDDVRQRTFDKYLRSVMQADARVVILPETALPAFFDRLPAGYAETIRAHARERGKDVLVGVVERRFEGERFSYFNSVLVLGAGPVQSYRKRHLVPFGEFNPPGFGWVLEVLKIPLTDFARGEATQPPLAAGGTRFAMAICYEDIFGEEVIAQLPSAAILANVSNDAWFGDSLAAEQHLQFSQMRAIETGRWMVRATNTGVTAAIDPRGVVAGRLPQFTAATLMAAPEPRSGSTPYSLWGNYAALGLLAAMIAFAALRAPTSIAGVGS